MKPIIGIIPSLENESVRVHRDYTDSVRRAGGLPFILPYSTDDEDFNQMADQVDGLLLTGGGDIDPSLFGEDPLPGLGPITPERDHLEIRMIRLMLNRGSPIFAICRGCQILNVAAGGDMYQDLDSQLDGLLQHTQQAPRYHASHKIRVVKPSLLYQITGEESFKVNSFHHQAVKEPAPGFVVSARTADGVIEAIESRSHPFVLGVQWHPENMTATDALAHRLFQAFIEACRRKKGQRAARISGRSEN
ncbi:MAG: gamma-glutamyl-gamma-aminobutyrate hydrolase family protein [Bacillaceae bacterium]|nr:gamma-glutamyl-gamma-aminobutyrate hydrolase family protein [Bacillaceae bacterium]